jgi:predicted AlkP superfamily phosphohydrolase/phosphomutase
VTADVLLIGLDAADADDVARLADAGELPVLAGLRADGMRSGVTSIDGLGDDAAWSSFATGVGPGGHGRHFHHHYRAGTYDLVHAQRAEIPIPPFWDVLAEHGARAAVLDVPKSPVGRHEANLVVTDWMSHGSHPHPAACHPASWASPLASWLDDDEERWDCDVDLSVATAPRLCRRAELRADAAIDVMRRAAWDVVIVAFAETHCAGHRLFGHRDEMAAVYRAVDAQCGRVMDAAGPDATVVVFSLIGMGRGHPTAQLADAVLARLARLPAGASEPTARTRGLHAARARIPRALRRRMPARVRHLPADARMRDFGRRRFWRVPADLTQTAIRCNVIGREPYGRVAPGAEFAALCDDLRREFLALVEPGTHRRLVREVIVTDERYPGSPGDFADLLVVWDRTQPLDAAESPAIGEVRVEPVPWRLGEHRDDGGFVFAHGPGIPARPPSDPVAAVDLAPTVARLLDIPYAGDGRVVPGVVPRRPSRDGQAAVGSMLNDDHRSA